MTTFAKPLLLAAVVALGMGQTAQAQSVSAKYPDTIASAIQKMGYRAELGTDSYGDPQISSAADGVNFYIYFYRCSEQGTNCEDIQFTAAFDLTQGISAYSTNSWNHEKAFGRAFVDEEDDPVIQHYVVGVDGMSGHTFEQTFDRWITALGEFTDFIGW